MSPTPPADYAESVYSIAKSFPQKFIPFERNELFFVIMSWWTKPAIEVQVENATSKNIPSGEQDLALNFEICDSLRSKNVSAKEAARLLKKRLYQQNPNVQILTLHLLDLCFKNGGPDFQHEVASKEFVDSYVAQFNTLRNQLRSPEVQSLMLEYLQTWALMVEHRDNLQYIKQVYDKLRRTPGIEFPEPVKVSETFLESATAPEWVDSDVCMKSGVHFTFYNRKHHCRNCGSVFLQEYCKHFLPLPHFGINEPVRVCDDCYAKLVMRRKKHSGPPSRGDSITRFRAGASNNSDLVASFDKDLHRALELSLKEAKEHDLKVSPMTISPAPKLEEMDEDMKRAIAASMADLESSKESQRQAVLEAGNSKHTDSNHNSTSVLQKGAPEMVDKFFAAVKQAQPRDTIYDTTLVELNKNALHLQPELTMELREAADKLQTLEDLYGRLTAISGYYDRFLDAELERRHAPARSRNAVKENAPYHPVSLKKTHQEEGPAVQQSSQQSAPVYRPVYSHAKKSASVGASVANLDLPQAPAGPLPDIREAPANPEDETSAEQVLIDL